MPHDVATSVIDRPSPMNVKHQSKSYTSQVGPVGLEPTTDGLKVRSSTD